MFERIHFSHHVVSNFILLNDFKLLAKLNIFLRLLCAKYYFSLTLNYELKIIEYHLIF